MKLKTLLTVGMMTLAAGLLPAGAEAATPAPVTAPLNAAAFVEGTAVQMAPVVVVRRRRRVYNNHRRHYRHGRRHVIIRNRY